MHSHDISLEVQNLQAEDLLIDGDCFGPSPSLIPVNDPKAVKSEKAKDCRDVNSAKKANSPKAINNLKTEDNPVPFGHPESECNPEAASNPESPDNPEAVGDPEPVDNPEVMVGTKAANKHKAGKKRKSDATKRQWAAWTRQEEENFFNALRQVGKNFEKITKRVETKNRNQVRHYYYRLVRRMNKLLGPEIFIDASNSRDTNAAMLRWWSLLEKQSCAASKLRHKPRRFKIFLETLETQLTKDRNRNRRKRPVQGEKCSSTTSIPLANKELRNDCNPVVDGINTDKVETIRNPPSKRNMKANNVNSNGNEMPPKVPARQKRKPGLVASAAYRRWEKAAKAGVSLVADAAAQFEKTNSETNSSLMSNGINNDGQKNIGSVHNEETIVQPPVKLKLQLFPIDELTRKALEKDACHPYLELTISGRKRFSSVFEHLNRKWGSSNIAAGQLMLFPFNTQQSYTDQQKWTKETNSSAAEVYASVGCPAVFRLRYGWFSNAEPVINVAQSHPFTTHCDITMQSEQFSQGVDVDVDVSNRKTPSTDLPPSKKPRVEQEEEANLENRSTVLAIEWADSLTNISVGDLLEEASNDAKYVDPSPRHGQYLLDDPFSCDSFDAVIATHTSGVSTHASHTSMWNADETCDEFSFKQMPTTHKSRDSTLSRFAEINERVFVVSDSACGGSPKELAEPGSSNFVPNRTTDTDIESVKDMPLENVRDGPSKDTNLMDIYWPDSLGAFEMEVSSVSKNPGQELIFGDSNSIGFLSRMVSTSLDAFQTCSLFGLDKRASTSEAK